MAKLRFNHASLKSLFFLPDVSSRPLSRLGVVRLKNWMLNEPFYLMALNLGIRRSQPNRG